MNPVLINVCEVFAPNERAAKEARIAWIVRGETLDIMYDNIAGLHDAELETKNFIYDELKTVIYPLVERSIT